MSKVNNYISVKQAMENFNCQWLCCPTLWTDTCRRALLENVCSISQGIQKNGVADGWIQVELLLSRPGLWHTNGTEGENLLKALVGRLKLYLASFRQLTEVHHWQKVAIPQAIQEIWNNVSTMVTPYLRSHKRCKVHNDQIDPSCKEFSGNWKDP